MTEVNPVIAVVGPGAVGGLLAWLLHRAGVNIVVVGRHESVERINSQGIRVISSLFGEGTEFVPASEKMPDEACVILTVKAPGLGDTLAMIAESRPREVLSLMNGMGHMDVLYDQFQGVPIAAGSIAVEAARSEDGTIEHKSPFVRLTVPSSSSSFSSVRALAGTEAQITIGGTDAEVLWRKFRFLAPLALLTSVWQAPLGEALARDPSLTQALLAEVIACEVASGVPDTVESLMSALDALPPTMRSSLQADLASGRPSELDSIAGELIRQAEKHDLAIPALRQINAALLTKAELG